MSDPIHVHDHDASLALALEQHVEGRMARPDMSPWSRVMAVVFSPLP